MTQERASSIPTPEIQTPSVEARIRSYFKDAYVGSPKCLALRDYACSRTEELAISKLQAELAKMGLLTNKKERLRVESELRVAEYRYAHIMSRIEDLEATVPGYETCLHELDKLCDGFVEEHKLDERFSNIFADTLFDTYVDILQRESA